MGLFDHFPYTNVHELNLDWLLTMMKALEAEWDAFTAGNSLTFADPLQHNISKTYAKNTIVLDDTGNAYVSLQAVPVGVSLSNQDYWLMVFDYEAFIEKVNKNFTARYYRGSYRATAAMVIGDWLTVDDVLCKATAAIDADDTLELGVNIEHFTLEDFIKAFMTSANQMIQQYKNDIDASELLYRQQLAGDIANTTASLQAQLDAAISGVTVDSEVINARVGADGVTYPTLGDAIRTQIDNINEDVDIIISRGIYGIEGFSGGLPSINGSSDVDLRKLYYNTVAGANYKRIMYYDTGNSAWDYINIITIDTFPNLVANSVIALKSTLISAILSGGCEIYYAGGVTAIRSDATVDTSKVYVSTAAGGYHRFMWYDGSSWQYAQQYVLEDMPEILSVVDADREVIDIITSRMIYGIQGFAGGLPTISSSTDVDIRKLYYNTIAGNNVDRLMYYDSGSWNYLKAIKITDYPNIVADSIIMLKSTLISAILSKGYEFYFAGGVSAIRSDTDADTSKVYVSTAAGGYHRFMWYDGSSWQYAQQYVLEDLEEMLKLHYLGTSYSSSIISKIADVLSYNANGKMLNITYITDTHSNAQDAIASFEYLFSIEDANLTDAYIHGGDVITSTGFTKNETIKALIDNSAIYKHYNNFMFVKGNHDNGHTGDPNEDITNAQFRVLMNSEIPDLKYNSSDPDSCYFYKDFDAEMVRVIIMDSFDVYTAEAINFNTSQLNWFYNVALDVPNNWTVVIFTHEVGASGSNWDNIIRAFNDRGTAYGGYLFNNDITTYLAGVIHGHDHNDSDDTTRGYNIIGVKNAFSSGGAVDIITIDTANQVLYETRFGSGSDRSYSY